MANLAYPSGAGITVRTNADLESSDMTFVGTATGAATPYQTDYTDIRDAITANPGGAIGSGTAATGLNVSGDSDLDGALTINDSGADKDTRIEGDTDTNLVFVDAGNDKVGIGTGTPSAKLHVSGDIQQQVHTDNVSNPPTDAEIDAIFGTPAAVGAGYSAYVDDAGGGANFYHIVSDGTNWWYFTGTKAV